MITLHFNPQYDSGAWFGEPGKGVSKFKESYVGPLGLLAYLEVQLGITAYEMPQHGILAEYTKTAQEAARKTPAVFFAKSLELSPLATAGELLRWRDELVLSGWKPGLSVPEDLTSGAKSILDGLAEVESALPSGFRTTADRWRALLATLDETPVLEGFTVKVHVSESHLHPVHRAVLDHLRRCGISVQSALGQQKPVDVTIKHFHDSSDACLWAAAQDGDALLVCSDGLGMASAMSAFGKPFGNAPASMTPRPVAHLFTSVMKLLKDGGDIVAFRDYLSASSHPLNQYEKDRRSLRKVLLDHVIRQRGFEGIDTIQDEFAEGDEARLAKIKEWLPEPGRPLTYDRISAMCDRISTWAKGAGKAVRDKGEDSPCLDQWQELVSLCEEMKFQCKELDIDNHPDEFMHVLRTVSAPSSSFARHAVAGSVPVVSSIESIAVDVDDVIWVDGSFPETPVPLPFLCQKDVGRLKEVLPHIGSQDDALQLADDLFEAGLSHIGGSLTILYCDAFAGKKREKHPFILRQAGGVDELKYMPFEELPDEKAEQCPALPIILVPEECNLTCDGLFIPDHESPTTLEDMFSQPCDWVLKSILHLYEESDSNDSLIKGLVAHDLIHRIYKKAADGGSKVDADAFERVFKADFEVFFKEAVHDTGAEMNLPENKLDREQFKSDLLTVSIPKLVEIIRCSHLTIVGSEVKSKLVDITDPRILPDSEPLLISGTIDLLLKNPAGSYVILDFKWTGSNGRELREGQILKGTDYQLALYRKMAETGTDTIPSGPVEAQAFFMLRTAELLTAYPAFSDRRGPIPSIHPGPRARTPQNTYPETLKEIYQKYSDTVRAFRDGKVSSGNLKDPYLDFKVIKGKLD